MKFPEILRQLRLSQNMNQYDFANAIGVSRSTIGMYETGKREPDFETLEIIADYFNVTMAYLIGDESEYISKINNIIPIPTMKKVPLLGTIACGEPILAEENIESYVNMPEEINGTFALRCKGDSMINARIFDGDIVYIRHQPIVNNGEIAAVLIGDEATLKKVYQYPNRLELRAENPTFSPLEYEGEAMNNIKILGKAVYFTSKIR